MRYDVIFIAAALLCLLTGVCMGMWMGTSHDFTYAPVHAHLNLLGWATLALYGLVYRAYPAMSASRLAPWHCAIAVTGSVLMPIGIAFGMNGNMIPVMIGSVATLTGVVLMVTLFARKVALAKVA